MKVVAEATLPVCPRRAEVAAFTERFFVVAFRDAVFDLARGI
ncbi:MAG TPA: hypothetical protein VFJ93_09835 [Gaiellaceae bacterium]|nr:hypothetical protein [Gaiellaceae bacterium]